METPGMEQSVMNVRSGPWGTIGCSLGVHTGVCIAPLN